MAAPLDQAAILRGLEDAGVRYVVTGSVAAAAYGVPVEPRDVDIAPDLSTENLERLASVLRRWNAKPVHDPAWSGTLSPEECEAWTPDPPTPGRLDHLMTTSVGPFDVVPWRSGWYLDLVRRAVEREVAGLRVLVAHPDDLIA
ncbi:MAG: hypothetical protein M3472_05245, partial [Chloroflexota bacterium]|nr:hypothetical protein [Chloroflexota bacterium]